MPPSIPRRRDSPPAPAIAEVSSTKKRAVPTAAAAAAESPPPAKKRSVTTSATAKVASPPPAKKRSAPAPKTTKPSAPLQSQSPAVRKPVAAASASKSKPKPTLFDTLDAPKASVNPEQARAILAKLGGNNHEDDEDEDSSSDDLSEPDSDDFEDVLEPPSAKRRKVSKVKDDKHEEEDDDDNDMEFEDVDISHQRTAMTHGNDDDDDDSIGDINISLNDDGTVAAEAGTAANRNVKKGPSKRDRQIRLRTHMMHVQALVFHNAVRNSWLNDKEVQATLLDSLSDGVKKEVQRWRIDMGYAKPPEEPKKGKRGKRHSDKTKGKDKDKADKGKRDGRDWGIDADRLEQGAVNMSRGDPIMRLLKVLAAYWKKRFAITAPGIRKMGYMPLRRLADDIKHWDKNRNDPEEHGERIDNIGHFRKLAKKCQGSRDVGAQLFTALMRALGIDARMVASLQPVGFGWSKAEDAIHKKPRPSKPASAEANDKTSAITISDDDDDDDDDDDNDSVREVPDPKTKSKAEQVSSKPAAPIKAATPQKPIRASTRGNKTTINQSDSSDLSDAPSSPSSSSSDDAELLGTTPSNLSSRPQPFRKYDRDLAFPHYWTEVLSPVSNTYIPVDSIVLSTVATTPDLLATFEPRGRTADTAKQVIAYTLAYSSDATAKDVTIRYLKKHQMPGRTKGFRMMPEKVPIHNKKGKVLRYEEQDWFRTVILPFLRPDKTRTPADEKEDSSDLVPFKPASAGEGKQKIGDESLQWYKQSADYVLERHLRREEALLPSAKPVRTFTSGKGDKLKTEPVYSRNDVAVCKTVESWHKEGREIKVGSQPMKMVPVRAVTLIRKREMEEAERETGEKLKQGLYSLAQTGWIIPPPIGPDRKIPRNAFGNMDVYVPSMVPAGAVHVRLKGCAKICRKLDIEHAEACVGFEFGKQRAVPVIFGVVVAEENVDAVEDAWRAEQEIIKRKEDVKREALMLHLWRKFVMGLRIVERMKAEYVADGSRVEVNPFVNRERQQKKQRLGDGADVDAGADLKMDDVGSEDGEDDYSGGGGGGGGGGFFLPGEEEALLSGPKPRVEARMEDDNDMDVDIDPYSGGGGFILDDDDDTEAKKPTLLVKKTNGIKPMSLQSAHRNLGHNKESDEDEDMEDDDDEEEEDVKPVSQRTTESRPNKPATSKLKNSAPASAPKVKPKSTAKKPVPKKATTSKKPPARKSARAIPPSPSLSSEDRVEGRDTELSDLTDLSSVSASDDDEDNDKEIVSTKRKGSPRVVITPRISRLGSIQSRFFKDKDKGRQQASNKEEDEDDNEEDKESEESEEEVIQPRRTTTRTRSSMG